MSERHESDRYRPIESLELEMRDRLAAKDAEISRLKADLARVRGQRDKFVREWFREAQGDSDADKERWLVAEGLRLVNGKVEEIES